MVGYRYVYVRFASTCNSKLLGGWIRIPEMNFDDLRMHLTSIVARARIFDTTISS